MKRALLHTADLASLILAAPASLSVLACSWRSGGSGVGRHSAFGCLAPEAAAAGATAASADPLGVTVTAGEAALLAAFSCLQAVRLLAGAARLLTSASTRLQLHSLATGFLLVATASVAVNNPAGCLYSVGFALQFLALATQLTGLGLAVAVFVADDDIREADGEGVGEGDCEGIGEGGQPVGEGSFPRQQQWLPFADDDERLVYEFRGDGRLEWRIGQDRGVCVVDPDGAAEDSRRSPV